MADPTYALEVEFVSGSYTNITDRMLTASITRQVGGAFQRFGEGHSIFVLDNDDRSLSPSNGTSPYAGNVQPGKNVKLTAVNGNLVLDSEDLSTSNWNKNTGTSAVSSAELGSDGTSFASRLDYDGSGASGDWRILAGGGGSVSPATSGELYSGSFYVRTDSGPVDITTNLNLSPSTSTTVDSSWQKITMDGIIGNGVSNLQLVIRSPGGVNSAFSILIDRAQLEVSPRTTEYIQGTDTRSFFLFNGATRRFSVDPSLSSKVTMECVDPVSQLRNKKINTGLLTSTDPSSVFAEIFTDTGVTSTNVSSYSHTIPFVWYDDKNALNAISELLQFGHYWIYADAAGVIHTQNQNWNLNATPVQSYGEYYSARYSLDSESVMNDLKVRSEPRFLSTSVQTVAWLQDVISIPASASTTFWLQYVDPSNVLEAAPAKNMISPVSSSDYLTNTLSGGGGTDTTATTSADVTFFGASALCTVFNGAGSASYLNKFQLRGNSIQKQPLVKYATSNGSSQALYGNRSVTIENNFIGTLAFAENYGDFLLARYKDTFPDVAVSFKNKFPDIFTRDIGQTIHLVESQSGLANDAIIQSVTHSIRRDRGIEHVTDYAVDFRVSVGFLVLDDTTNGKLDVGRLGF